MRARRKIRRIPSFEIIVISEDEVERVDVDKMRDIEARKKAKRG